MQRLGLQYLPAELCRLLAVTPYTGEHAWDACTREVMEHTASNVLSWPSQAVCKLQELLSLVLKPELNEHYSLHINLLQLSNFDIALAENLVVHPCQFLLILDRAAVQAQQRVAQQHQSQAVRFSLTVKGLVHVRLYGLTFYLDDTPAAKPEFPSIGSVRSCHVDKLITVSGTVVRTGSVTMMESHKLFECTRCGDR